MILQAFRAELFKLLHNRGAAIWAYLFVPIVTLVFGIGSETVARNMPGTSMIGSADPIGFALNGLAAYGNSVAQLFLILGAAMLFAGEYRWETWRAILPRNSRTTILIAKALVFMLCAAASIILASIADFIVGLYKTTLYSRIIWPPVSAGEVALAFFVAFATTFIQILATAAFVATVAVVTRSLITAIIAPLVVLIGLEIATIGVLLSLPIATWEAALYPNIAARSLRGLAAQIAGDADAFGYQLAGLGAVFLVGWTVIFTVITLVWFRRQDLSRE